MPEIPSPRILVLRVSRIKQITLNREKQTYGSETPRIYEYKPQSKRVATKSIVELAMLFDQHTDGSDTMFARGGKYKSARHNMEMKSRGGHVLTAPSTVQAGVGEVNKSPLSPMPKAVRATKYENPRHDMEMKSRVGRILNMRCIPVIS